MTTALITGSSTGIGLATALDLARHGYTVYATMRNPDTVDELQTAAGDSELDLHLVKLDVTDSTAVASRVKDILDEAGGIDVLVKQRRHWRRRVD